MATATNTGLGTVNATESTNTDNSKAYGAIADTVQTQVGSNITLVDSAGVNLSTVDPGAIAAASNIATTALDTGAANLQSLAGTANLIATKSIDLATASQQGQGGTLINGVIAMVGLGVAGWVAWSIWGSPKRKKEAYHG